MRPWHRKLIKDTIKAAVPFKDTLRCVVRKFRPYRTNPANDVGLLEDGLRQIEMLRAAGVEISGADVLEFGSGWNPVIPLLFHVAGARTVTLTDQERLLDQAMLRNAADFIITHREKVAQRLGLSVEQVTYPMSKVWCYTPSKPSLTAALDAIGFRYLVPFDPKAVPSASADIIVSRTVLEHVPPAALQTFLSEFKRILKPDGTMAHLIDLSDHWEHHDKSISRVNFLKYPDWLWRLTCLNPQNYQNRLRRFQYQQMLLDAGFRIVTNTAEVHEPSVIALQTMKLAERFRGFAKSELAVITANFVARA